MRKRVKYHTYRALDISHYIFLQKYINIMDYSRNNIVFTVTYLSVFFEVKKEKIIKRIAEIIEGG